MLRRIIATVLLVRDLVACTAFYRDTLGFELKESDPDSASFVLGDQYLLLLGLSAAGRLLGEGVKFGGGPQVLLAAGVEDVDATYEALRAKGVTFLRPPTDQSWGLRTAHFADPEGNFWEINQPVVSKPEG
jgi:lactoylglutathione lyase